MYKLDQVSQVSLHYNSEISIVHSEILELCTCRKNILLHPFLHFFFIRSPLVLVALQKSIQHGESLQALANHSLSAGRISMYFSEHYQLS